MIGSVILGLCLLAAGASMLWMRQDAVRAGQAALSDLVNGSPSAQARVDWAHLKAMGVDVGATYTRLPNDRERDRYREAFIEHCSRGFRQSSGAGVEVFVRWRRVAQKDGRIVVAADYPAKQKTLLVGLSGDWFKKVVSLQWE